MAGATDLAPASYNQPPKYPDEIYRIDLDSWPVRTAGVM